MREPSGRTRVGAIAWLSVAAIGFVALAALGVTHAQLVTSAWPVFQHDLSHTGQSEYNTSAIGANVKWQFSSGEGSPGYSSPSIGADGTIYFGNYGNGNIYAVNPDGSERWVFSTGGSVFISAPAIGADGTIYVGSGDRLYALTDGGQGSVTEKWTFATGGAVESSPAIGADGTIYFGSFDDNVYALTDGGQGSVTKKWAFATSGAVESSPAIGADGTIYVGSDDDNLYALTDSGSSATEKWAFLTEGEVQSSPAIGADGTVYFASDDPDENLYALTDNGSTYAEKWADPAGANGYSSPAVGANGTIYFSDYANNNILAFNVDGSDKWQMRLSETYHSSPTIGADGTIYLGQASVNPTLIAVTDDGTSATQKWAYYGNGVNYSSAAIGADGTIYFLDNAGYLNALGPMVPSPVPDQPAATTSYDSTATADVTLNFPPGVAADDICVGEFSYATTSHTVKTVPNGWTPIRSDNSGSTGASDNIYWYKSLGGGSDPVDFTWTLNGTDISYVGWIQCFSGVNLDTPIDPNNPTGVGTTSTSATSLSVPALSNLAQSNEALILNCVARKGVGANPWSGPLSPYSQIVGNGGSGLVSATTVNLIAYSGTAASNDAPPVQTCTQSNATAGPMAGSQIALQPAPLIPTPTPSPASPTATSTSSSAPTRTSTATSTGTATATPTATATATSTATSTATATATSTSTSTPPASATPTATPTTSMTVTASLAFGNVPVGDTATKNLTIHNTGRSNSLVIASATPSDPEYALSGTGTCGVIPITLAHGTSCTLGVSFTPNATGAHPATLTLSDNAATSPQSVSLSGTGTVDFTVSKTSLVFGNVKFGATQTRSLTVTNHQTNAVSLSEGLSGTNHNDFALTAGTCGSTLAAKTACKVSVVFTPGVVGTESATLTIADSPDSTSPYTVAITTGPTVPPTVAPATLAYGTLTARTPTKTKNVTVGELPGTPLSLGESITGSNQSDFRVTGGTCGPTATTGTSCTIAVTFTPTDAPNPESASIAVTIGNDPNSPHNITLTGTGP